MAVKFGEKIEAQIWQTNVTSDFVISCYFWATKKGNLPKPDVTMKTAKLTNMARNIVKASVALGAH